jgi:ubiquinone/menaquinone biosynthesis C-methylase UbiE
MTSYGYQIKEVCKTEPKRVLEIGIGTGIAADLIRRLDINVSTFDINATLQPDVVGTVLDIHLKPESFDTVLCCEVLEHLPFDSFPQALSEIRKVTRRSVVLSLPDKTRFGKLELKIPKVQIKRIIDVPLKPRAHTFDGEHYWEIGKQGFPLKKICACIERCGFSIKDTYRIWENPNHRIFVLEK